MRYTFEPDSRRYWIRAIVVVTLVFGFGLLPLFVPTAKDPGGFVLIVNLIGVGSMAVLVYARPRKLSLTMDKGGVVIRDRMQRVLVSRSLSEVDEVSLGRWGHILNHSIGWIILREEGRSKPSYYGAISGEGLSSETACKLREAFKDLKAGLAEEGDGSRRSC